MRTIACCWQDLDAYHEEDVDGGIENEAHYMSAAPSGWDDPDDSEVPPPYMQIDSDPQDHHHVPNISRGESFVSPAMFVWGLSKVTERHWCGAIMSVCDRLNES